MADSFLNQNYLQGLQLPVPAQSGAPVPPVYPMTPDRFYSGLGNVPQIPPAYAPPPLGQFTQRGQELTTAGEFAQGQAPTMVPPLPSALSQFQLKVPEIPEAVVPSTSHTFDIPGQGGPDISAPDSSDLAARIAALQGPAEPGATDKWGKIAGALGGVQWDERQSTGANLFNIGSALTGGVARSEQEESKAQADYQEALRAFELQKLQLESGLKQQDFENTLKALGASIENLFKPTLKDGTLMWGTPLEGGGQRIQTEKIGPSAQELKLQQAQQLAQITTPDIQKELLAGRVPQEMTQVLLPKLAEAQSAVMQNYGAQLMQMEDATKRATMAAYVNQYLMNDPEIGSFVQQLIPVLQEQSAQLNYLK